jgi:hypothetical protein
MMIATLGGLRRRRRRSRRRIRVNYGTLSNAGQCQK